MKTAGAGIISTVARGGFHGREMRERGVRGRRLAAAATTEQTPSSMVRTEEQAAGMEWDGRRCGLMQG
jgi:hypothetical protein